MPNVGDMHGQDNIDNVLDDVHGNRGNNHDINNILNSLGKGKGNHHVEIIEIKETIMQQLGGGQNATVTMHDTVGSIQRVDTKYFNTH